MAPSGFDLDERKQDTEELVGLLNKLSHQQLRYIVLLWYYPDDFTTARAIGVPYDEIKTWHTEPTFERALDLARKDAVLTAKEVVKIAAPAAAMMLNRVMIEGDSRSQLAAADSVLDRVLGKPVQKVENDSHIEIITGGDQGPFKRASPALPDGRPVELDAEARGDVPDGGSE